MLILRCWLAVASGRGIAVKHTAEHLAKLPPESGQELHGAHILGLPRLRVALLRVSLLWVLLIALGRLAILWWRGCLLRVAVILGKSERRAGGEAKQGCYAARKKSAVHVFKDS